MQITGLETKAFWDLRKQDEAYKSLITRENVRLIPGEFSVVKYSFFRQKKTNFTFFRLQFPEASAKEADNSLPECKTSVKIARIG